MMKNYETEARERWGNTDAYREHTKKTENYTNEKWSKANDGLMAIFAEFAACKGRGIDAVYVAEFPDQRSRNQGSLS